MRWAFSIGCALCFSLAACRASTPAPPPVVVAPSPTQKSASISAPVIEEPPCKNGGSACYARAETLLETDAKQGEKMLDACVQCPDAPPAAFRLLATARADRGAKDEARVCLQRGIEKHPASDLLWVALARMELAAGRSREGLSAYASAERLRPNDEMLANEYRSALESYGSDEEKSEAAIAQLVLEASGRAETGDLKGAEQTLRIARDRAGKVPRLVAMVDLKIAMVLVRRGEHRAALAMLESLQKTNALETSMRAEAQVTSSEVLLALKRPKDAVKAAESAIELEPKNVLAHANLGVAYAACGEKDKAMVALQKACDLGLSRRLTYQEFMAIGAPIASLASRPDFAAMVKSAWPLAAQK